MSGPMVLAGLIGAFMLALGSDMIVPVSAATGGLCALAGVASSVVFFGLIDGA
jgi:hypothetical protein